MAEVKKRNWKLSKNEAKKYKSQKSKKFYSKPLVVFAIVCLIGYAVANIVSQRVEIAQIEKQSEEISAKITEAKQQNDEYVRMLSENDEAAYMERIAIERLGYAYPNERRFYIVDAD
ncbi:MAG: septum formation initiator family protein [Oscillospiraceae bacterium]